ncbi:hypothetical protein CI109_100368 [Kwoniella shandongensis]|uniref:Uncharacterized protein n=1 Tax=Kwoniella shandongensis TaxID=1734106 RepID=A0AAJ8LF01_9TREE
MLQNASEILSTTWSAVEAAVSVILVLAYGYYSRKINLLSEAGEEATSLPLLLLTSLGKNGTLAPLVGKDDLDQVLSRGKVYLLINALVCNLTRFTFGPRHPLDISHPWSYSESPHAMKKALTTPTYPESDPPQESDPLLGQVKEGGRRGWKVLQIVKKRLAAFMNPPMYGGLAAVVAGLIPFLHRWLFSKKGFLNP